MADKQPERPHIQFKVNILPTMRVKRKDGGECVINKADFDPDQHTPVRVAPNKPSAAKRTPVKKEASEGEE